LFSATTQTQDFKIQIDPLNVKLEASFAHFWTAIYKMASFFYCVHFIGLLVKWKVQHGGLIKKNLKYFFESSDIYILFFW